MEEVERVKTPSVKNETSDFNTISQTSRIPSIHSQFEVSATSRRFSNNNNETLAAFSSDDTKALSHKISPHLSVHGSFIDRSQKEHNILTPERRSHKSVRSGASPNIQKTAYTTATIEKGPANRSSESRSYKSIVSNVTPYIASVSATSQAKSSFTKPLQSETRSPKSLSVKSEKADNDLKNVISNLEPQGKNLSEHVNELANSIQRISKGLYDHKSISSGRNTDKIEKTNCDLKIVTSNLGPQGTSIGDHVDEMANSTHKLSSDLYDPQSVALGSNIDKIANMSKVLTDEANALRESIRHLSADLTQTKQELELSRNEDCNNIDFPYHLFLIEIIINKIHMKCECFEMDSNNLVISATFLGKNPIILYDSSCGRIDNFNRMNVGKSSLFAMTYDKICAVDEFLIILEMTKQPPCTHCVTKIGESQLDYTQDFLSLREELCKKWSEEQPKDNILCTTSTPLLKNQFYLSCGERENPEPIGYIDCTVRMSFLGKEITTAFCTSPKPQGTSLLLKENNGMTMYSCQKVEMDDEGKILLDEDSLKNSTLSRIPSPLSQLSSISKQFSAKKKANMHSKPWNGCQAGLGEFRIRDLNDEINKLMREKRHWEVQIKSLGGPDHARVGPKMLDQDGKEVPGNRGYKYFGAAKDLPGVRELFSQEPPPPPRRTRADLMRDVDADYYGYRDDDDGLLIPLEQEAEKQSIAQAVDEWKRNKEQNNDQEMSEEENIYPEDPDDKRIEDDEATPTVITSHVAIPSQKDIEEALLRKKKQELLERYGCLDVKIEES